MDFDLSLINDKLMSLIAFFYFVMLNYTKQIILNKNFHFHI